MASSLVCLKSRVVRSASRLALATAALCGAATPGHAQQPWPSQVQAVYKIEFNGFEVGSFEFSSAVAQGGYSLSGDARLSALLGVIQWQGATRSSGVLAQDQPRPAGYSFDYAGAGKSGAINMGFQGDAVANLTVTPVRPPEPGIIAVRETHLKGVLDPLSAVMAMARTDNANPCGRKLAIFDGKQRFDLMLTYKRQERVAEARPSGQPGVAFVCRVRYIPIAGHKANEETRTMEQSSEIEISLRPIPSANLFVPHQISVPTGAGTVRIVAQQVRITTRNEQIALVH